MKKLTLLLTSLILAALCFGQNNHRWKVLVIVPEQHIQIRHIPDPAVETELNRQLIDADFKVIDKDRVRSLIHDEMMDRLMRKDPSAVSEAIRIGRKVGADIVVTGEAFSELVLTRPSHTDLGTVAEYTCRARVELKAYLVDTAEMVYADAITKTGAPDLAEELASKTCLQDAAEEIAPKVVEKLEKGSLSPNATLTIEVRNVSYSLGSELREVLRKAANAIEISDGDYDASACSFDVTVPKTQLPRLTSNFEGSDRIKKMHLVIQQASKTSIILNHKT